MISKENVLKRTEVLQEVSVHCKKEDGYGIIIIVEGSITGNGEYNPSHAHIWTSDKKFSSRFLISSEIPPQNVSDLKTVSKDDPSLSSIADSIIRWANAKPIRAYNINAKTNWDAMRESWTNIQDTVNCK